MIQLSDIARRLDEQAEEIARMRQLIAVIPRSANA